MRRAIGLELLVFFVLPVAGLFTPSIMITIPDAEPPLASSNLQSLQMFTMISMVIFLLLGGAAVVGRYVLGIMRLGLEEEAT
jgi:hypothetical protein